MSVAVGLSAGALLTGDIGWGLVLGAVVGAELIDLVDHPLHQALTWRRDPALRQALRRTRSDGVRAGWQLLRHLEDSRSIDGLYLHNAYGLLVLTAVAIVLGATSDDAFLVAAAAATVGHMHCDILWDLRSVGHARNWTRRRSMPWRSGSAARLAARGALLWLTLMTAVLWWCVGAAAAAGRPVDGLEHVHRLVVAALMGYLGSLLLMTWYAARRARLLTGNRSPLARGTRARGWRDLLERLHPRRQDVVAVSAGLALLVPVVLHGLWQLQPSVVQASGRPGAAALTVPLACATLCWSARHTSAAGIGTLLGVLLADLGNQLLVLLDATAWDPFTTLVVYGSGLLGWSSGLLLSFTTGRVGGSVVLLRAVLPEGRTVLDVVALVEGQHRRASAQQLVQGLDPPRTLVVSEQTTIWEQGRGGRTGSIQEPVHVTVGSAWSPLAHESAAMWAPTFAGEEVRPLLPRSAAGSTVMTRIQGGRTSWPGCPEGGMRSVRSDGTALVQPVSEMLDHLLTVRATMQTDVLVAGDGRLHLWVREVTSSKQYTTPETESLALDVRDELTALTGGEVSAVRLRGSGSLHDLEPDVCELAVTPSLHHDPVPDEVLAPLRPATRGALLARFIVATSTAVGLADPLLGPAVRALAGH